MSSEALMKTQFNLRNVPAMSAVIQLQQTNEKSATRTIVAMGKEEREGREMRRKDELAGKIAIHTRRCSDNAACLFVPRRVKVGDKSRVLLNSLIHA